MAWSAPPATGPARPTGAWDHIKVAELAIERAKRLVELGVDVGVLLASNPEFPARSSGPVPPLRCPHGRGRCRRPGRN